MDRRVVLAWLLVVVFLVFSCAAPACSSRPLADGYDARKLTAVGDGGVGAAGRGGNKKPVWSRRSLGTRTTWPSPPKPNKMRASATPAPPPPRM